MEKKIVRVNPNCLYPVEKIDHLDPQKLELVMAMMKDENVPVNVKVICYNGYYFIISGHCEVLAANILHWSSIEIEILDRLKLGFWNKDENLLNQLKYIGMNSLYDFENVGFFKYEMYPSFYKGDK